MVFKKKKVFSDSNSPTMRKERKRTWQNILAFLGILIVLFGVSFALAWNLIGAQTKPNNEARIQLEEVQNELVEVKNDNNELLAEIYSLREQLYNSGITPSASVIPSPSPSKSPDVSPSVSKTPTPSPVPSKTATPSPTPSPSPKASPENITSN